MQDAEHILRELLDAAGFAYTDITSSTIAGQAIFSVQADDGRDLIGHRGETIHAIDHLVKKILEQRASNKNTGDGSRDANHHFLVDVNGYRAKQIKDLQMKALMMAERARSFQYDVELTPMSAYERLIIHTTLHGSPNIKTESQGEGRNRRVVIKYSDV